MAGRKSTATMELAIGATIIAGIIILIVMLMAWGNSSVLAKHYRVVVNMVNVGGLKEGAPVKMGGFQIGRVASIQIRPGATDMEIVLDIDEERLLPRDSSAKVSTAGLVGDAFMEIIPGKSNETLRRAATVADAERIESSPLPDLSELLTKVNEFGDELIVLAGHLNDIVGDQEFRRSVKSMAVNIDSVSYQANLIMQRSQTLIDNIEVATKNIADLSGTLNEKVDAITSDLNEVTTTVKTLTADAQKVVANIDGGVAEARTALKTTADNVNEGIADARAALKTTSDNVNGGITEVRESLKNTMSMVHGEIETISGSAKNLIANVDGGVTDARSAIANTIGNRENQANISSVIADLKTVAEGLAQRRETIEKLLTNLGTISEDFLAVSANVKVLVGAIEPDKVSTSINTLSATLGSVGTMASRILAEPVLALSVNKAADRIVKMKFDEMAKSQQFRSADDTLREINRWVRENMNQGYMQDPKFEFESRPYRLD